MRNSQKDGKSLDRHCRGVTWYSEIRLKNRGETRVPMGCEFGVLWRSRVQFVVHRNGRITTHTSR